MIKSQQKTELSTSLELTPLIDIIFIVVVFLLLTANTRLLSLPVDVPSSEDTVESNQADNDALTLSVFRDSPVWAIEQERFDNWSDFKIALLDKLDDKSIPLHIAAEHDAEVESLLKLLALLNKHEVPNTQILMEESQP